MKRRTQKLIFYAIAAVFVSFLLTCSPFAAGGDYDESGGDITYTDVEYSPDGGSVTIYLDGSAPVRSSRALSLKWAKLGHDFFEVAFYHPDSGTVARAAWETGHAAGVNGVRRNVNYIRAYYDGASFADNEGAAIIFVGKKSDRTLLGVGSLIGTNDSEGGPTFVSANTRSVTFSVAALKAGVNEAPGFSSFKTNSRVATTNPSTNPNDYLDISIGATEIATPTIGRRVFPLFVLDKDIDEGLYMHGRYEIEVVGLTTDFENLYRRGIYQKANIEVKNAAPPYYRVPRYPSGDNDIKWETPQDSIIQQYIVDTSTGVDVISNNGLNIPFTNPVLFRIGPSSHSNEHKVFAFAFEIPVYPLTDHDNRKAGFSWYIRPGYDSYLYDLDDGAGGNGGSILIGTGQFIDSVNYSIYVQSPPNRTKYNGTGGATAYNFSLDGLVIYQRIGQSLSTNAIQLTDTGLYFVVEDPHGGPVTVIKDGDALGDPITGLGGLFETHSVNGAIKVKIRYYGGPDFDFGSGSPPEPPFHLIGSPPSLQPNSAYNGDLPLTGEFTIYYFPAAGGGLNFTTPGNRRYIIRNWLDFLDFQNNVINNNSITDQTFILVFFNNFDLGILNHTRTNPVFIIVLAGTPDIIIGKTVPTVFSDNGAGNLYYFGVWPFDEVLAIDGIAINSEPFYLNAGGSYVGCNTDLLTGPDSHGNSYFISGGVGTKTVNDMGITVINRNRFYQ